MVSRHADALVWRALTEGLGARKRARLRRHLDRCPRCRGLYAQGLIAERALLPAYDAAGQPDYLQSSPRARARAVERLLDAVDPAPARPRRWRWAGVIAGAAVAAAVAAAGLLLWLRPGPELAPPLRFMGPDGALVARGAGHVRPAAGVDLRLICLARADDGWRPRELADGDPCGGDEVLFLAYTALRPALDHLFIIGQDPADPSARYYPRPGDDRSLPIAGGDVDRVLGRGVLPGRKHPAGPVTLVALFTPEPLDARAVEAAASTARTVDDWSARFPAAEVLIRHIEVPE